MTVALKLGNMSPATFFFQIVLAILDLWNFRRNFRISFSISEKKSS